MAKYYKKSQKKSQRKRRQQRRKTERKQQRGGELTGAPLSYSLSDTMSGKQSMAQGLNYLNYHRAQHGGVAPFPQSVEGHVLGEGLRGSALMGTLDKAYADIAGLKDASPTPIPSLADGRIAVDGPMPLMGVSRQSGGKKRGQKKGKKSQKSQKSRKSRKSQKSQRRRRQQGGSALGYQLVGAPGLLLETPKQYTNAGLNPDYTGGISTNYVSTEQMDANARDRA
jgi:hypothetical protein